MTFSEHTLKLNFLLIHKQAFAKQSDTCNYKICVTDYHIQVKVISLNMQQIHLCKIMVAAVWSHFLMY
jgi:hypothetical protein